MTSLAERIGSLGSHFNCRDLLAYRGRNGFVVFLQALDVCPDCFLDILQFFISGRSARDRRSPDAEGDSPVAIQIFWPGKVSTPDPALSDARLSEVFSQPVPALS